MTSKSNELHSGWTPGPWCDDSNREQITASVLDENDAVADVPRDIDRAIIALAPEMAEAILRVQEAEDQDAQCRDEKEFLAAWREFHHVHAKIRTLKDST